MEKSISEIALVNALEPNKCAKGDSDMELMCERDDVVRL